MTAPAYQQTEQSCPKCGGAVWDNRGKKTNAKQPDLKCQNRACDWAQWPPRQSRQQSAPAPQPRAIGPEYGNLPGVPMEAAPEPAQPVATIGKERLERIFKVQEMCFAHSLRMASEAEATKAVPMTLEGVSALTAQALIQFFGGR